jgi:hypothetical protein
MKEIVLVLIAILSVFVYPLQAKAQTPASQEKQQGAGEQPQPPPAVPTATSPDQQKSTDSQGQSKHEQSYWNKAFAPEMFSNWILVLVGLAGIGAAICTLKIIARQTKATEDNVSALINSERPWLLLQNDSEKSIQRPYLIPVETNMGDRFTHCIFWMKNYGRTPGCVFASKAELQIGDNPTQPPDLSVYEMIRAEHNAIPVPPDQQIPSQAILTTGFIKADDVAHVEHGGKYLWLCGFIKYRDTFERTRSPEYETRFCWLYENRFNTPEPFWKPAGPSEYNRAT